MTTIILYLLVIGTFVGTLFHVWLGVIAYYLLAVLQPQAIWFWVFGDLRISLYIAIFAGLGFLIAFISGKVDFSILRNRQNLYLAIFWGLIHLSLLFSSYAGQNDFDSHYRIGIIDKMFLMYFVAILLIDTKKKFHYLIIIMLISVIYYAYWGNNQYFSGLMWGRLKGPLWHGNYADENAFAMFFVMGMPFLYFMGFYYKNKFIKYLLWGCIPWTWHAIFLTASRGGLIGIGVVTLFIAYRSKSKLMGIGVLIFLIVAFVYQGGYMRERGKTIVELAPNPRYESWDVGGKIIKANPLLGVGLSKFVPAYPDYNPNPENKTHVAHSSIIQITAECGILAGLMFLMLNINLIFQSWTRRGIERNKLDPLFLHSGDAIIASLLGFFTCSIFLDLAWYEVFYFLLVMSIVRVKLLNLEKNYVRKQRVSNKSKIKLVIDENLSENGFTKT